MREISDEEVKAVVIVELGRIEESSRDSAQSQFEQSKQWRAINLALGIPASALAAIAGATALSITSGRIAAGLIALVSAAIGAVLTSLNPNMRATQAGAAANSFLSIQTAARQARTIAAPSASASEARAILAELTARRDKQNADSVIPNKFAYRRGQSNISSGGQTYEVDKNGGS